MRVAEIMQEHEMAKKQARLALLKSAEAAANHALRKRRGGGGGGGGGEEKGHSVESNHLHHGERNDGSDRREREKEREEKSEKKREKKREKKPWEEEREEEENREKQEDEKKFDDSHDGPRHGKEHRRHKTARARIDDDDHDDDEEGAHVTAVERLKAKKLVVDMQRLLIDAAHAHGGGEEYGRQGKLKDTLRAIKTVVSASTVVC